MLFYAVITAALIASIVPLGIFPDALLEPGGLTPFKIYSEYLIAGLFLLSRWLIHRHRASLDPRVTSFLLIAIGFKVCSEIAFTLYGVDVYGTFNALGHIFKGYDTIFIYLALVQG